MKKQELTRTESRGLAAGLLGVGIASVLLTNDATAFVLLATLAAVLLLACNKPGILLRLYRWQLRASYTVDGWMERHPRITNAVGFTLWIAFCLQMFVGCMDYMCGVE